MQKILLRLTLGLSLAVAARAQTWTWVGDGSANIVTAPANWSPGGLAFTSATELVFGDSGSYTPSPFLGAGNYEIGTLTLTRTSTGMLFSGNGDGTFSGGLINGLNITTAINFSPSAGGVATNTTGPLYLGSGVTIGGTGVFSDILVLGAPKGGGNNGIISSAGAVTKSGAFQLQISGNASGLGQINLEGGTAFLTPTAAGFQSDVVTSSGTTFGIHPNTGATYTYAGTISGSGGFQMNGNPGSTSVLTGSNSYSGSTRVNAGTLSLGADNTLPSSAFVSISPGATLDVAGNQTINNFVSGTGSGSFVTLANGKTLTINPVTSGFMQTSYDGTISGSGSLVINGSGSLLTGGSKVKLGGNNAWGSATIVGGSLELTGVNTGGLTINGGALLGGSASITGTLAINSGATFASVTSFTAGASTLAGGAAYLWGLADANGAPGTGYGTLNVNGALTLGSGTPITLQLVSFSTGGSNPITGVAANFDPTHPYSFTLASSTGITGFDASNLAFDFTYFQNTYNGTWAAATSLDGNSLLLNYTPSAIPEPSTVALGLGLCALGAARLRQRRRHSEL